MSFSPFGNGKVTPRRALGFSDVEESAPRRALQTSVAVKVGPSIFYVLVLVILLLSLVVGDTQANTTDADPASVSASTVPEGAVAQTATSTTTSASEEARPIPKVAESSAPVKPKSEQSENFAAAIVAEKVVNDDPKPSPTKKSATPSQKRSVAPKKAVQTKKAPAPKKKAPKPVAASTSSGSTKGLRALAFAQKQIGEPYSYGGDGPSSWDCSGLTMKAWAAAGVGGLPHSARSQYSKYKKVSKSNLRKGDLVFFYSPIRHVGVYAGNGNVLHASRPGKPVGYLKMKYMPYAGAVRPG